jgi:hypothetical protein
MAGKTMAQSILRFFEGMARETLMRADDIYHVTQKIRELY